MGALLPPTPGLSLPCSAWGQTLKLSQAAWPPGRDGLLSLCSGLDRGWQVLGLVTGGALAPLLARGSGVWGLRAQCWQG